MHPYYVEDVRKANHEIPFRFHVETPWKTGIHTNPHIHEYIEILYCHEGVYEVLLNNTVHPMMPGDMIVITPNVIHSLVVKMPGGYSVIQFAPDFLYSSTKSSIEPKYILPFITGNSTVGNRFSAFELNKTDIPAIVNRILTEHEQQAYGYEIALKICAEQLFLWILRQWDARGLSVSSVPGDEKWHAAINRVLNYIWENYSQNITARDMAKLCFVTYGHFSVVFKRMTGTSFMKYLTNVRIMQSKTLLLSTELSITEIAQEVGFSAASYYIEQFRKAEGISPYRYRKSNT